MMSTSCRYTKPVNHPSNDDEKLDYCPAQGTPFLKLDNSSDRTRYIVKARCKQWTCPYCAKVNKHQHYIRILNGCNYLFNQGYDLNFVTITSHKNVRGLLPSYRVFQKAWKTLSQRARRQVEATTGLPLAYVYIPETHRDGTLHWHGVFTGGLSTRWWKDNCAETGMGHQAKSVKLDTGIQATNYCLKYVTKHIGQEIDIKRFRRINYSQNFPDKPVADGTAKWQVVEAKTSIVALIHEAWYRLDYDAKLHGQMVDEIIDNE